MSPSTNLAAAPWEVFRLRLLTARMGPLQGWGLWGSVLVVAAFLAISVAQYGQPYVIDEAAFPYAAEGILKNGAPYFYNGETRPNDLGLWHPPLYEYLLAGQIAIWGMSPFAVRSFGALCIIAAFFFLALALRRTAPGLAQYGYVVLAALFLLNPLVIAGGLVPDIDGTLGVLVLALALWVATIVAQARLSGRLILGVLGLATIAVSTKFTIAGIVAVLLGCSALIATAQRWWKVLWVVVAFVVGAAVSFGLLAALGALSGFDALDPLDYLFASNTGRGPGRADLAVTVARLVEGPSSNVVWIGPALILSSIVAFVALVVARPIGVHRPLAALALASSLAIIVGYAYVTGNPYSFPKYVPVAVGGFAIVASLVLTQFGSRVPLSTRRGRPTMRILSLGYALVLAAGTLATFALCSRFEALTARSLRELLLVSAADFVGVTIATGVLVLIVGLSDPVFSDRLKRAGVIGLIAATALTPIMVQTSSALVNMTSPFATRYYYREAGMVEFLAYARSTIPAGDSVIAPKDVGLQLHRPYYEDAFVLPLAAAELREYLTETQAEYLVTRSLYDYSEVVFPEQFDVLREFYEPVFSDPDVDFTLWELKSRS